MNSQEQPATVADDSMRRKLMWSYGIIAVLVVLLAWSLLAGSSDVAKDETATQPEPATTTNPAALCLQLLTDNQASEALPICEKAFEQQPGASALQHNLGYAYKANGKYEEAIRMFAGVVEKDPLNVRATYELAESYRGAGQIDKARATYEQVLEIEPTHGWAQRRLGELPQ